MVKSFAEAGQHWAFSVGYICLFYSFVKNINTMAKELAKGIEAQGRSKSYHRR
jgi:hypothetical protein